MRTATTIILGLILGLPALCGAATQGTLRPVDLRCEYRTNPLGIDAAAPRLSWKLEATDPAARGLSQSAYRVLVASSQAIIQGNQGNVWDSGKVNSDQSIQLSYGGKPLASGEMVWWKVQVWDIGGNSSTWSSPAHWSMGLLAPSDWKGKWIGLDGGEEDSSELARAQLIGSSKTEPGTSYLRRIFEISKTNPVSDALLILVSYHPTTLSINGGAERKSKGNGDPISLDITSDLHTGTNLLSVAVQSARNDLPAVIGAVELNLADSERVVIPTDNKWRASSSEVPGWNKNGFDDASWEAASDLATNSMPAWAKLGSPWRTVLPARMLRKEFTAAPQVKRATLYVSGLGLFEAYLNGEKVGHDVLAPALSEYDKRVFYLTYDVTKLVKPGANALGVMLGNGRFFAMRHNIPTFMRTFGYPQLRLQLEMEMADGRVERVCSDETWKVTADGPIRSNNEYDGEVYDARKDLPGWSKPGFHDAGWPQVQVLPGPAGVLSAQPMAPIRVAQTLKPVSIHEVRPGVYVYDLGQNIAGWCRLAVAGPRGTTVDTSPCRTASREWHDLHGQPSLRRGH